jgi:hypothetical protein
MNGYYGLDVKDILRSLLRPDIEVGIILERDTDKIPDGILQFFGQFRGTIAGPCRLPRIGSSSRGKRCLDRRTHRSRLLSVCWDRQQTDCYPDRQIDLRKNDHHFSAYGSEMPSAGQIVRPTTVAGRGKRAFDECYSATAKIEERATHSLIACASAVVLPTCR